MSAPIYFPKHICDRLGVSYDFPIFIEAKNNLQFCPKSIFDHVMDETKKYFSTDAWKEVTSVCKIDATTLIFRESLNHGPGWFSIDYVRTVRSGLPPLKRPVHECRTDKLPRKFNFGPDEPAASEPHRKSKLPRKLNFGPDEPAASEPHRENKLPRRLDFGPDEPLSGPVEIYMHADELDQFCPGASPIRPMSCTDDSLPCQQAVRPTRVKPLAQEFMFEMCKFIAETTNDEKRSRLSLALANLVNPLIETTGDEEDIKDMYRHAQIGDPRRVATELLKNSSALQLVRNAIPDAFVLSDDED